MEREQLQLLISCVAILLGSFLQTTGIVDRQDAKAASLFLNYVTFPALVLQSLLTYGLIGWAGTSTVIAAVLLNAFTATYLWKYHGRRRAAERALLAGTANTELGGVAYAFVQAGFDAVGVHFAVLWDLGNLLTGRVLSRLILGKGSSQAPERYQHADGGVYRGEWRRGQKHGLGVYQYPNGARYEGRWADNVKHGVGIYHYPKGGWFEGEWKNGERSGIGLRILSTGKAKAGLWQGQSLLEVRDPSQCAYIAAQAHEVAKIAKRVTVGQHGLLPALGGLLKQPVVWAVAIAAASTLTARPIPLLLDFLSGHLASAHIPLMLFTFGISLDLKLPEFYQIKPVAWTLAIRCLPVLAVGLVAATVLTSTYTDLIAVAVICALGPISEQVPYYAQLFNLNVSLGGQLQSLSKIVALTTMMVLSLVLLKANPGEASVPRGVLIACLGIVSVLTGVLGSTATWILSRKTPKLPTQSPRSSSGQALSANSGAVASTPETPIEEVPIGIAWKELREEQAEEKRGNTGQGTPTGVLSDREAVVGEQGVRSSDAAMTQDIVDKQETTPSGVQGEEKNEGSSADHSGRTDSSGSIGTDRNGRQRRRRRTTGPQSGNSGFTDLDNESASDAHLWQSGIEFQDRTIGNLNSRHRKHGSFIEAVPGRKLKSSWQVQYKINGARMNASVQSRTSKTGTRFSLLQPRGHPTISPVLL